MGLEPSEYRQPLLLHVEPQFLVNAGNVVEGSWNCMSKLFEPPIASADDMQCSSQREPGARKHAVENGGKAGKHREMGGGCACVIGTWLASPTFLWAPGFWKRKVLGCDYGLHFLWGIFEGRTFRVFTKHTKCWQSAPRCSSVYGWHLQESFGMIVDES